MAVCIHICKNNRRLFAVLETVFLVFAGVMQHPRRTSVRFICSEFVDLRLYLHLQKSITVSVKVIQDLLSSLVFERYSMLIRVTVLE